MKTTYRVSKSRKQVTPLYINPFHLIKLTNFKSLMCPGWNVFVSAFKKNLKAEVTMCISKKCVIERKDAR